MPDLPELEPDSTYLDMVRCAEVEAHVQRINHGPDGDLISYDLTAKAQAQLTELTELTLSSLAYPDLALSKLERLGDGCKL